VSDEELRALQRQAEGGDSSAMVRTARLLLRQDCLDEALEWLHQARVIGEDTTQDLAELAANCDAPLLLARLVCLGDRLAPKRLTEVSPSLAVVCCAEAGPNPAGLEPGDGPDHSWAELEAAIEEVLDGEPDVQLAGLLLGLERLVRTGAVQPMTPASRARARLIKNLASRVLKRKRTWREQDLVLLLGQLARVARIDLLPWAGILGVVEAHDHGSLPSSLRVAVEEARSASLEGRFGQLTVAKRFRKRAKALLDGCAASRSAQLEFRRTSLRFRRGRRSAKVCTVKLPGDDDYGYWYMMYWWNEAELYRLGDVYVIRVSHETIYTGHADREDVEVRMFESLDEGVTWKPSERGESELADLEPLCSRSDRWGKSEG
jgi:hypothetical protein